MHKFWLKLLWGLCVIALMPTQKSVAQEPDTNPPLRIVASQYEPFVFEQNGELVGFDIDVLDLVCRLNKWNYSIDVVSFQEMLHLIASDSADIAIGSIYVTEERWDEFSYSTPYLKTGLVLVSRTSDPIHRVQELSGLRIGVKAEATGEDFALSLLKKDPDRFTIIPFETTENSFAALQKKKVDAVFNDFINSQFLIAENYRGALTISRKWFGPNLLTSAELGYPVSDRFQPHLPALNRTLQTLDETGMIYEIREKWLIHTLSRDWSGYLLPGIISIVLLVVILGGLFWYFRQRLTIKNRRYYQEILEASSDIIAVINPQGNIKYINESVEKVLGFRAEDLIGESILEFSEYLVVDHLKEFYYEAKARDGQPVHMKLTIQDTNRTPHEFAVSGKLLQNNLGVKNVVVNARDITKREEAERALRRNVTKYRALIESANDAIFIAKADTGVIVDANRTAGKLVGRPLEEIIGSEQTMLHPPDQVDEYREVFRQHILEGSEVISNVYVRHANGEDIPVEISASTVEIEDEVYVQGIFRDIRERKKAEDEIRLFKNAVESVNECISITDMEDKVLFVNRAFENTYGFSRNELIGKNIAVIRGDIPEEQADSTKKILPETIRGGWTGEIINTRKDGTKFPVRLSTSVIRDEQGEDIALIGVAQDITEEKRMEEELLRAEKLESLGTLAGGIAHDFNNILTSVIGNLSLAKAFYDKPEKLQLLIETAEESAVRATNLTKQMLTFSKGGQPVAEEISVRTLLRKAADLSLSGSNVDYEINFEMDDVILQVDTGQMRQAIGNILLNASQAMPGGGTINISVEPVEGDATAASSELAGGEYLRIAITDTGTGIAPENIDKIFDPFFSTKDKGTGLGLATSYSIVKRHGGSITVDSTVDEGTTFHIYLPLDQEEPTRIEKSSSGKHPHSEDTTGKILIMDDEKSVREVCGEMLEYLGYQVLFAEKGEEALELYAEAKEAGEPVDLVIMDLTIPGGMGGIEAVKALHQHDENAKTIVSSGYSTSPVMANYEDYGFDGVVNKPYQLSDLKREIRRVLRGSEQNG